MQCCEGNVVCSCDHSNNELCINCHPYLRTSYKTAINAESCDENCLKKCLPCGNCCFPGNQSCMGTNYHYDQKADFPKKSEQDKHFHRISHSCPLGKIICSTDCHGDDCQNSKDIIRAKDLSRTTEEKVICDSACQERPEQDEFAPEKERPCCPKITTWTEPRICRCDPNDPIEAMKCCQCECGADVYRSAPEAEPAERQIEKRVRFADDVVTDEHCENAFRNLNVRDAKELCRCCKECVKKGSDQCFGKSVLVYEFPEPKFDDESITHKDFCWKKTFRPELPPWHPNIKDRWHHMTVPSLAETTYQCDYKPPSVGFGDRGPVYLAPLREKIDPCQHLSEEYAAWKKTTAGPKHVYHSSCDTCDKDLQRVHLHECDVAHLPPQYRCHGDGHLCQPPFHATGEKFTLCERGDTDTSKYWWKRTCCVPDTKDEIIPTDLPPDLMKPVCPSYTTSYQHDFRHPRRLQREGMYLGKCSACNYCTRAPPYEDPPNLLCTKDTRQHFLPQKAGIL